MWYITCRTFEIMRLVSQTLPLAVQGMNAVCNIPSASACPCPVQAAAGYPHLPQRAAGGAGHQL